MAFYNQLSEKLEAQKIYDQLKGKHESRFSVNGQEYAFLATSIAGDDSDSSTQWYLEFENLKSHRIGVGDDDKAVSKAFSEAVDQWVKEKQPTTFYTYGSHIDSIKNILEAVKKKIKKYNVIDYTEDRKDESTGETIEGNPLGKVVWSKVMAEDEGISSEELANKKNDEFEKTYEEPQDIKLNKKFTSFKKDDKLDKGDDAYGLKTEGKGVVKWKRVYKYVGKGDGKEKVEYKETPNGKRPKGVGWEPEKIGEINESTNQKDYKFYVVGKNKKGDNKIESGWEFKEDAQDQIAELKDTGISGVKVLQRAGLKKLGLDPDKDSDWGNLYRTESFSEFKARMLKDD